MGKHVDPKRLARILLDFQDVTMTVAQVAARNDTSVSSVSHLAKRHGLRRTRGSGPTTVYRVPLPAPSERYRRPDHLALTGGAWVLGSDGVRRWEKSA